jgi:thiamine-monophosphate kinase
MRVTEIGEFGLIARLRHWLPATGDDVLIGVGDDVAVLRVADDRVLLATCDIQVEDVHFRWSFMTPRQLGFKAAAINLSDIASMGGQPRHLLVSLALPTDATVEQVQDLYAGLREAASPHGVDIIGGNISRSPTGWVVDLTLLGQANPSALLLRSGAGPGDRVLVTGTLGDAAAGLALSLDRSLDVPESAARAVRQAFVTPIARVREGRIIAQSGMSTAMIDLSDGLAGDVDHICQASEAGVRIWAGRLPVSNATRTVAKAAKRDPLELALFGGEDYELLCTAPPEQADELARRVTAETGTMMTVVGEMVSTAEGRTLVHADGTAVPLTVGGWDHFHR